MSKRINGMNEKHEIVSERLSRGGVFLTFLTFVIRFLISRCVIIPLLCVSLNGFSQPGAEIGLMGGAGYYLGEYNSGHFNPYKSYIGGLYRYNLNDRFALRLNAGFSKIEIRNRPLLPNGAIYYPDGFKRSVKDFSAVMEFNFRSFMVRKIKESSWYSPYIFAGVGFLSADDEGGITIPLGVGVKFNLYRQFSWGIEWGARKLFSDLIDGVADPWKTGENNFLYNRDWFMVAGITLTYRFPLNRDCHF